VGKSASRVRSIVRAFALVCFGGGVAAASMAGWLSLSHLRDVELLREQALAVTTSAPTAGQKLELLNTWVYANKGFAKNPRYFGFSSLGPTPIDVLEAGGDCADKSRLLSSMLRTIGIESSLAMLYPCPDCDPEHTVVIAKSEEGWIVADPVYNVMFPEVGGGYMTVGRLMASDDVLTQRLRQLKADRGPGDKINEYELSLLHYRYLTTVNWNKNVATRLVAGTLEHLGHDPRIVPRPQPLEDPKYALEWLCALLALALLGIGALSALLSARISTLRAR